MSSLHIYKICKHAHEWLNAFKIAAKDHSFLIIISCNCSFIINFSYSYVSFPSEWSVGSVRHLYWTATPSVHNVAHHNWQTARAYTVGHQSGTNRSSVQNAANQQNQCALVELLWSLIRSFARAVAKWWIIYQPKYSTVEGARLL